MTSAEMGRAPGQRPAEQAPPRGRAGGAARHVVPLAAVVLLGLFAYANSLRGAFVFDDVRQIRDNPLIRDLGHFVPGSYLGHPNRYLAYLSFALNYRFGQLDPSSYHAVNLAIHLLAASLVYALVLLLFRTPLLEGSRLASAARAIGFAAAAIFVTHPIQTQAVSYVVQRLTSLAACLYLLALVLYAAWRSRRPELPGGRPAGVALYGLAVAAAVAAVKTKEIAFTLPLMIACYELCFFEAGRRRILPLLPFLAAAGLIPLGLLDLHRPIAEALSDVSAATRVQATVSRLDYLRTQAAVVVTYLRLLVLPVGQNLDHDYPLYHAFLAPRVAGSLAVIGALVTLAAVLAYRSRPGAGAGRLDPGVRLISFGIAWFFVALLVESSLIPIVDVIYEHRVYLPSVGLLVAGAAAVAMLAQRLPGVDAPRVVALLGVLAACGLAAATLQRNVVWADDVALWSDAAAKSPRKSRPQVNLGTALAEAGRLPEAAGELRRAVDLDPESPWARAQLGAVLLRLGRPQEAEPELREAIRLAPDDPEALFNLAMMLARTGRAAESRRLFRRFLEVAPPAYGAARRVAAARAGP